jgi:hypothetical protein
MGALLSYGNLCDILSCLGQQVLRPTNAEIQGMLDDPLHRIHEVFEHPTLYLLATSEEGIYLDLHRNQRIRLCFVAPFHPEETPG